MPGFGTSWLVGMLGLLVGLLGLLGFVGAGFDTSWRAGWFSFCFVWVLDVDVLLLVLLFGNE